MPRRGGSRSLRSPCGFQCFLSPSRRGTVSMSVRPSTSSPSLRTDVSPVLVRSHRGGFGVCDEPSSSPTFTAAFDGSPRLAVVVSCGSARRPLGRAHTPSRTPCGVFDGPLLIPIRVPCGLGPARDAGHLRHHSSGAATPPCVGGVDKPFDNYSDFPPEMGRGNPDFHWR